MANEVFTMSQEESGRLEIMQRLASREISQMDAAIQLGLSTRQVRNLQRRYQASGLAGLISKRRGALSHNRLGDALKIEVLSTIKSKYTDFGPTLAHEKLTERHGLHLSVESVRKLMLSAGLWAGKRRRAARIHPMRARRPCYGELVQIDGSPHAWFEERGPRCCLHVMVDDATKSLMALYFAEEECTAAYFAAIDFYLKHYGRPLELYSDKHSIFRVNIPEAKTGTGETQFGRAMRELGIKLTCAHSPQAKGRVERANGTLQDRLVKEMRLQGISTIAAANDFVPEFILDYNKRFAEPPASPLNAHRQSCPAPEDLALLLSQQCIRKISKNLEVSYNNLIYQIQVKSPSYVMRGSRLQVCDQNGKITLLYKGQSLEYKIFDRGNRPTPVKTSKQIAKPADTPAAPKESHPWRRYPSASKRR